MWRAASRVASITALLSMPGVLGCAVIDNYSWRAVDYNKEAEVAQQQTLLLNIIRANPQFAQLKIIMLTSRSSEKHRHHAQELGSHAYLTKPCPQDTLLATIQSVLAYEGR